MTACLQQVGVGLYQKNSPFLIHVWMKMKSFCDYLGLSNSCSYDVDEVIGRADRFGFQNFCSPDLSHLMRLWHFSSYIISFFKCACPAIQWGRCLIFGWTLCLLPYFMCISKALPRLRGWAGSPEPSLIAYVVSTIISWAGSFGQTGLGKQCSSRSDCFWRTVSSDSSELFDIPSASFGHITLITTTNPSPSSHIPMGQNFLFLVFENKI